jgi:sulfide:quinone oxidoreductase
MLASRGIAFHPLHRLQAFEAGGARLVFEGREAVTCALAAVIPPHRGSPLLRDAGLANEAGWVPVDTATLATRIPGVYAIGDATAVALPGRWKPEVPLLLPKAGVFAHAQGEVVARRIAAEISAREPRETFCGDGYCMLEAGEDLSGFAYGDFFATPAPEVHLRPMGRVWHLGKVLFERWWLMPPGPRRAALGMLVNLGARAFGLPARV